MPGFFERTKQIAERMVRASVEEVAPVLSLKVLAEVASSVLPQQAFVRTRTAMLRAAGVRIGEHSLLLGAITITGLDDPCAMLSIGANTIITGPLRVDLGAPIRIGNWVRIGHDVALFTIDHAIGHEMLRSGLSEFHEITVGDGAWIASRVTVLPGVSIGAGAIVAAGAVVTRDVPEHTMVAGIPARVIRSLPRETNPDGKRSDRPPGF